jgi:DNA-binding LacI/PurR family transcriptional regulator
MSDRSGEPRADGGPVRLRDVAREAGVHPSTVSRVLSGGTVRARPETLERIRDTARQLGYRPNAIARGLRLANVGAFGLLLPSLRNPVLSAITRGSYARAWERDFVVVIAEDSGEQDVGDALYGRLVQEGRIDGLMIASARPDNRLFDRLEPSFPHVFVNRGRAGSHRNVTMREEAAGRLAADHLFALGHHRLGHVAGPAELDTASRRATGFVSALAEVGLEPAVVHASFEEQSGFDAMRTLLDAEIPPTGVFVSNINQAIGALAATRAAGRNAPHDISIVGYDDDPMGRFLDPPLTAIRMPLQELGATATDALIAQIGGEPPRDTVVPTPPELLLRGSTAPPPA